MRFSTWMRCALVFMVAGCGSAPPEAPALEKSPSQVQAERLVSERGFDLQEVAVVPVPGDVGDRHALHFQGIPIQGLEAKTANGVTSVTNVRFEPAARTQTQARVTAAQAEATVLARLKDPSARVEATRLVLLPHEERRLKPGSPVPAAGRAHNADHFERVVTELTLIHQLTLLTGDAASGTERYWSAQVEARSGQLLRLDPLVFDVGLGDYKPAAGRGYYSGKSTLSVLYARGVYVLQDPRGNKYRAVLGEDESEGLEVVDYESTDARFGDGELFSPGGADSDNGETAAVDALFAANLAWSIYEDILGRQGPTGNGRPFEFWLHHPMRNASYIPHKTLPRIKIGYRFFPVGGGTLPDLLVPLSTTDIVGHEMGHDFFMREVAGNPVDFPSGLSELAGMNEGSGDIFGFVTELSRDGVRAGRNPSDFEGLPLKPSNLEIGEETGFSHWNLLTPAIDTWFNGIGSEESHRAGSPLSRMFLLLAYGCAPWTGEQSTNPWSCPPVPEGFSGLGPTEALRLWSLAVQALPMGADYLQARQATLDAVRFQYGSEGSTPLKAVGSAFAAINVGGPPESNPPTTTLSCAQVGPDIECTGTVTDTESPNSFDTPPLLVVDNGQSYPMPGWQFTQRLPGAGLPEGTHTVQLKAWDRWLNRATQTVSLTLDKTPPTASVTRLGPPKQPHFSVTAHDNAGVARVEYFDNAVLRSVVYVGPFDNDFDTSSWTDGTHDMMLKVYDPFSNVRELHHALVVDNTRPSVSMTVGTGAPPFAVSATVSDVSDITRVDFKMDGVVFATRTNSATSYQAQYTPIDPLAHNLHVEVTDAFGNVGVTTLGAPRDLTPPAVTFEKVQTGSAVRLTVGASDTCGLRSPYALYVDGNLVAQPTTPGYVLDFGASMADGTHAFQALVQDNCGNTTNFQTVFFKGLTPPVITGVLRDDTQPKKPKFTVQCTDTEGVHHVEMRENGVVVQTDTTAPYEFIVDTTARQDGNFTVLFHCSDVQGAASTPETRTVTADNTGPTYSFTVYGSGRSYFVSAGTVSDPRGIKSVILSGGVIPSFNITRTQTPYSYQWVIPGTTAINTQLPFSLVAEDTWGNKSSKSLLCNLNTASTQPAFLSCQ
ncbi:MAG: hypothetical protein EOO71_06205 [Myxococcaceae bacterium]|nr:MAG: hypothetical protein EOO71_06205 [Myxococcaceae bacterium]